jgi:peptide maturation system protein (TIGR04066 family)
MERVIVYPFDNEFLPVLRHREFLKNHEIVGLVAPSGWGFAGKDAGSADGGNTVGFEVGTDYESCLDICDTVLISDYRKTLDFKTIVFQKILKAIDSNRNIICTLSLDTEYKNKISDLCKKKGLYFKYYHSEVTAKLSAPIEHEKIYEINAPVLCISGISENTSKFEVQLMLRKLFLKENYKVSQIGSRSMCELLGFHSFPSFMYDTAISESNKVVLLNQYIRKIEGDENPDIIILGIPGGILPFNNSLTNKFGILAYMVSQAVIPDAVVMCTLHEDYMPKYFDEISLSMKYKLGFDIDGYILSNTKFDWDSFLEQPENAKQAEFYSIISSQVDKKIETLKGYNIPVFNILNERDSVNLYNRLVSNLTEYGTVESL